MNILKDITEDRYWHILRVDFIVYMAFSIPITFFRLVLVIYLLVRSLGKWRRRECFVQSVLWLSLVCILLKIVNIYGRF